MGALGQRRSPETGRETGREAELGWKWRPFEADGETVMQRQTQRGHQKCALQRLRGCRGESGTKENSSDFWEPRDPKRTRDGDIKAEKRQAAEECLGDRD